MSFNFTLDSFQIANTRSKHEDTDYLSFTLKVGGGAPQTLVKSMGNINNGLHAVGLTFSNVQLGPADAVVLNYVIVNSGQNARVDVETTLENAGALLANGGGPLHTVPPKFSSALQVDSNWFATELKNLFHSNCDGAVAAEQDAFTINDLFARSGGGPFHQITTHPGTNSASGCGSNSNYIVNWHMATAATVPDVAGLQPGPAEAQIRAQGLVPVVLGSGRLVANQAPSAGVVADAGSPVTIRLGNVVSLAASAI